MENNKLNVNNIEYNVIKLLGKGKGGYSYLVELNNNYYVLKQIHHEPCSYYNFGNKIESELNDYKRLLNTNINLPKLIDVDIENERIIKEYIDGPTIYDLVKDDKMKSIYIDIVKEMANKCKIHNLNIDYYPTNFIVSNDDLYYIDYECNIYDEKWNLENWGIKYWSKTDEFIKTLK
jgi:serine/threonine protein kinase